MKHILLSLALAATLVAVALSGAADAQQADEDPSPDRTHPQGASRDKAQAPAKTSPSNPSSDPQTQDALAFTGVIRRVHDEILLKDPVTKMVYKFDDASKVEAYVGKQVKVVGKLGLNSNTIHVSSIQVIPHEDRRTGEPPQSFRRPSTW